MLVLAHQRGGRDFRNHVAGVQTGIRREEWRQVMVQRRVHDEGDAALGDRADLRDGECNGIGGEAYWFGVEVAA